MANTAGTSCCRSRKPESVAFLELFWGWPQSEGVYDSFFLGAVERDETGRGVSACLDLDLASVQAIHEKGDRRPAPPAWRLPEGSMPTSDQPGGPTVVVLDLPTLARLARFSGLRPTKNGHYLATSAIS